MYGVGEGEVLSRGETGIVANAKNGAHLSAVALGERGRALLLLSCGPCVYAFNPM